MASSNRTRNGKLITYEPYVCRLTAQQRKFVEKEFLEVDEIRSKWIDEVRRWAIGNRSIGWCRLDGLFLLRFLRYTKFARRCAAPVLAEEALVRYLTMRHIYPEWCRGLDPRVELMQKMIHDEVFTILGTDSAGQMIVWIRLGRFDVNNLDSIVLLRFTLLFLELLAEVEVVQIGGIKVWVDYKDTTWRHFISIELLKEFKTAVERAIPVWIREVHNVGLPDIAVGHRTFLCKIGIDLGKYRTFWHATWMESRKHFEEANWPEEYGGRCNSTRQAGYLSRLFEEKRDALMELDRMDIEPGLEDIRFFKPSYGATSRTSTGSSSGAVVKSEPMAMATVKNELSGTGLDVNHQAVNDFQGFTRSDRPLTIVSCGFQSGTNVNCEFARVDVKNFASEASVSTTVTVKIESVKKQTKKKKKKTVKPKVDTGRRVTAMPCECRNKAQVKIENRQSLPGDKSYLNKPWKY